MMRIDERLCHASADRCFQIGADVERWPEFLPHYRWVTFVDKKSFASGVVEMAAWRPFGVIKYPTWWRSRMWNDPDGPTVYYKHIGGITTGMDVRWEFEPQGANTLIRIVHEWDGPRWPLIGRLAANFVIGPMFVSAIAQRTLAGVAHAAGETVNDER